MLIIRRPKRRRFPYKAGFPHKRRRGGAARGVATLPIASQENGMVVPARAGESYLAWFDGACEPVNPGGTASFGVVITDNAGTVLVKEHGIAGKGSAMSNNVAEYAGVLHVLKYLSSRPPGRVTIHGDSNLVINQLNGKWRIKKGLYLSIALETKELLAYLRGLGWQINFCWIPREQNEECDALSKKTADKPDSIHSLRVPA